MPPRPLTPGDPVTCVLCGGDEYVSHETARMYGRPEGDSTCPACDGKGKVPYRPLPPNPAAAPRPDDKVCACGCRNRKRWLYCALCAGPI